MYMGHVRALIHIHVHSTCPYLERLVRKCGLASIVVTKSGVVAHHIQRFTRAELRRA